MEKIDNYAPDQPLIEDENFLWPGPEGAKKKQVDGVFATGLYVADNYQQQQQQELAKEKDQEEEQQEEQQQADSSSVDVVVNDGCELGQCWDNISCGWVSSCDVVGKCGEYDGSCEKEKETVPQREPVGYSYCTFSPDTDCYITGWPACCSDSSIECPEEYSPECEINLIDEDSYCTASGTSADYSCYKYGRPECCEIDATGCPEQKPECDVPPSVGDSSYCTYGPNPECYTNWWPACCSNDSIECPEEQPNCERSPIVSGSSYCTYTPDYSCYDSGRPSCCSDDAIECPKAPPSCNAGACKTLGKYTYNIAESNI